MGGEVEILKKNLKNWKNEMTQKFTIMNEVVAKTYTKVALNEKHLKQLKLENNKTDEMSTIKIESSIKRALDTNSNVLDKKIKRIKNDLTDLKEPLEQKF
jgi:hypothetical protein